MAVEKAFAIKASPRVILAAIERDLNTAGEYEGDTFEVLRRQPDRLIELRVTMGGFPCTLGYTMELREDHTEVVATLVPYGWRYTLFRIMTLGMREQMFAVPLVEGLANLKETVEGRDWPQDLDSVVEINDKPATGDLSS